MPIDVLVDSKKFASGRDLCIYVLLSDSTEMSITYESQHAEAFEGGPFRVVRRLLTWSPLYLILESVKSCSVIRSYNLFCSLVSDDPSFVYSVSVNKFVNKLAMQIYTH